MDHFPFQRENEIRIRFFEKLNYFYFAILQIPVFGSLFSLGWRLERVTFCALLFNNQYLGASPILDVHL